MDCKTAVQNANSERVQVLNLSALDFRNCPDHSSAQKLNCENRPMLNDI